MRGIRTTAALATVAVAATAVLVVQSAAGTPLTMQQTAASAVNYADGHGYHAAIAVLDTASGQLATAGDANSGYASESVVKAFIAARLLVSGQMTGGVASTAWRMITQSDDASANALYGRVGGDGLVNWVASYFHISGLGSPPPRPGWWGGTRITASGLVRFYAAAKRNARVGPWLFNAMHHAARYGSDGTYQWFGLPSATSGPAIKQGWGFDYGDGSADVNSTGLVNGDRYAVAILMRGPGRSYLAGISAMQTQAAKILMPGGRIPAPEAHNPIGHVDAAWGSANAAHMNGWALDPDDQTWPINVAITEGNRAVAFGRAWHPRPDVNRALHVSGDHGWGWTFPATPGTHTYCVVFYNVLAGTGNPRSCYRVTVPA